MTVRTRAALNTQADTTIQDNTTGDITAAEVRAMMKDIVDSAEIGLESMYRLLDADEAHANDTVVKNWFASAGVLTIPLVGTYMIDGQLRLNHGTTSHTTSLLFGGTATVSWIEYLSLMHASGVNGITATQNTKWNSAAAAQVINAATTVAEEAIKIDGLVRFSAVGTFIPQFNYSAAPGVTTLTKRGTNFRLTYLGDGTFVSRGSWA